MRLPKTIPPLRSPHYILAPPAWLQLLVISLAYLLEVGLLVGLGKIHAEDVPVPLWVELILWLVFLGFSLILTRSAFYHRWVSFACDREACYFRQSFGLWHGASPKWVDAFVKVPWDLVGEVQLAPRYLDGDGSFPSVLIEIKMSQQTWQRHCESQTGTHHYGYPALDGKAGQIELVLANSFHKIEHIKARIDALRPK